MAFDFDGTNDAISLGNSSTLNPTTFSISAWVNADDWDGGNTGAANVETWILARDDNTLGRSFAFGVTATAAVKKWGLQINGAFTAGGLSAPALSTWIQFGCAGTSGNWAVYQNGASVATDTTATGATTIGQRTYVDFQGFANARIAEVGFWNVILTAAEMAALGRGYSPILIRPDSLLSYVPLVRALVDYKRAAPTLVDAPVAGAAHPRVMMPRPGPQRLLHTASTFQATWARSSNLPVLGTGTF